MKTAISIPDRVFGEAERFAKEKRMTRSALYAAAVREYLKKHRREGLTERINEAIEGLDTSLPPEWKEVARQTFKRNEW